MKDSFKVGQIAAVIDDTIKGIVTEVNNNEVTIEVDDGFLMTFEASELVLVKGDQREFLNT